MNLLQLVLIGIGLSMDAFSLSLIYGTLNLTKKMNCFLSFMVGCFHFFMPILGSIIGTFLISRLILNPDHLVGIIFIVLSIEMLLNTKELKEERKKISSLSQALLFSFSVSLDSFSVGIGLGLEEQNMILCGLLFSIISATFTKLGLDFGKKLAIHYGKIANEVGSVLLFILGVNYFFSFV